MSGTNCDLFTHKSSWSYSNYLVHETENVKVKSFLILNGV
jgi:hypothetical protein